MLTLEDIHKRTPSVFSTKPWEKTSQKYQFLPTSRVVEGLMNNGFECWQAKQSRTRIEGKENFTKHVLRFRLPSSYTNERGEIVPEVVLFNSHDGTTSYRLMLGLFRIVCSNGLVVASNTIKDIRIPHKGKSNLIDDVIEGSYEIIKEFPKVQEDIDSFQNLSLTFDQQKTYAKNALSLLDSSLEIDPATVLRARRFEDNFDNLETSSRSLWKTMNVVQENIVRGGVFGISKVTQQHRRLPSMRSVSKDTKFNRDLWSLTEKTCTELVY